MEINTVGITGIVVSQPEKETTSTAVLAYIGYGWTWNAIAEQ